MHNIPKWWWISKYNHDVMSYKFLARIIILIRKENSLIGNHGVRSCPIGNYYAMQCACVWLLYGHPPILLLEPFRVSGV